LGIGARNGIAGAKWEWPDEWNKNWLAATRLCKVTNYADFPIFEVSLPISVAFIRIERDPTNPGGSFIANQIIGQVDGILSIAKIDPGKENPWHFYIYNQGRDVLRIELTKPPTYVRAGDTKATEAQLLPLAGVHVSLWPLRELKDIIDEAEKAAGPP
jgi:hypothetical protein